MMQKYTFGPFSQQDLLKGLQDNDPKILQWIYESQYPKIEKFVLSNNGDEQQAKDIFQEAFVVLWKKVKSENFNPENDTAVTGYLYQIAKNKWMDKIRESRRLKITPLLSEHEKFMEENPESKEAYFQWMLKEFKNLGNTCQEILKRFYFNKESMETIASAFQWTEATARNNKYRCIQRLREKLKADFNFKEQ